VRAVRTLEVESGGQTTRAEGPAPVPRVADLTSIGRPGAAEKCVRAVQDETGRVVQTFMAVLSRRQHAIDGFDLAQPQTLFFALRFLFYMGLISTLLHLPALAAQGISLSSPSHALSFLTDEILEKLALCLALHVAMRSVGGKAELRESVCAVCFLCAFQPLIAVSLIPGHLLTGTLLSQTADGFDLLKGASAVGAQATAWQMTTLGISFAISGVLWVVFFVALFKASRTLHRLGWLRAATALVMGTAAWLVIQAVLLYPFEANMYKGFTRHA
jgi:hypothetical protein